MNPALTTHPLPNVGLLARATPAERRSSFALYACELARANPAHAEHMTQTTLRKLDVLSPARLPAVAPVARNLRG